MSSNVSTVGLTLALFSRDVQWSSQCCRNIKVQLSSLLSVSHHLSQGCDPSILKINVDSSYSVTFANFIVQNLCPLSFPLPLIYHYSHSEFVASCFHLKPQNLHSCNVRLTKYRTALHSKPQQ